MMNNLKVVKVDCLLWKYYNEIKKSLDGTSPSTLGKRIDIYKKMSKVKELKLFYIPGIPPIPGICPISGPGRPASSCLTS